VDLISGFPGSELVLGSTMVGLLSPQLLADLPQLRTDRIHPHVPWYLPSQPHATISFRLQQLHPSSPAFAHVKLL